eukprot:TRINITY_DN14125_c0_g1_i1.p1 TRINITY_DN14125_c0_g1~~TRINITY_DN14125_c0_g1_i1.p1  ORF type:complete len:337 (-),score=20.43 TRINITY_DN14125_c0_g1_i1:17-994(-)
MEETDDRRLKFRWKRFNIGPYNLRYPAARGGHTMVFVENQIFMFGGHARAGGDSTYYGDLWTVDADGNNWGSGKMRGVLPEPRAFHTATAVEDKMVVIGGRGKDNKTFTKVHFYDTDQKWWEQMTLLGQPPEPRYMHSTVLIGSQLYVFGGCCGKTYYNDCYVLDLERLIWTKPQFGGALPPRRANHTAVVFNGAMYIFGGGAQTKDNFVYYNDVWMLDPAAGEWTQVRTRGKPTTPRSYHSCDVVDTNLVIFGGWGGGKTMLNDISYLDMTSYTWREPAQVVGAPPGGRYGHTTTPVNDKIMVYGGWEGVRPLSDSFSLSIRWA